MRPIEWLLGLNEQRDGYEKLLVEAGSLPAAAWRLAQARCLVWPVATSVPNATEVLAAATEIASRVDLREPPPGRRKLASLCEELGLLVL